MFQVGLNFVNFRITGKKKTPAQYVCMYLLFFYFIYSLLLAPLLYNSNTTSLIPNIVMCMYVCIATTFLLFIPLDVSMSIHNLQY
jgi:protein-S-isoprenylcysteine O-methyltransferase Ste14